MIKIHLTVINNLVTFMRSSQTNPPLFLTEFFINAWSCVSVLNRRESDEKSIDRKAMIALSPYYKLQCGGPPVTGARQRVWITQYRRPSGQVRYTYKRDFVRDIGDPQVRAKPYCIN